MKTKTLLFLFLAVPLVLTAQDKPRVSIGINAGTGFSDFYEAGASPLTYLGLAGGFGGSFKIEAIAWQLRFENTLMGGIYAPFADEASSTAFGLTNAMNATFMRRLTDVGKNKRWVGITIANWTDLKINSAMMNASTALGNFSNIGARFMLNREYVTRNTNHSYTIDCDIYIPLLGIIYRPGYSYMDNYTANTQTTDSATSNYKLSGSFLNGATTSLGFSRNLYGYNIRVSYDWLMITTNNSGCYRFVEGIHMIKLGLNFYLN